MIETWQFWAGYLAGSVIGSVGANLIMNRIQLGKWW